MSIAASNVLKIIVICLVGLAAIFILMRPDPATSIRKINASLVGREKTEEGAQVSLELSINPGGEIEVRLMNRSDRDLIIYPPAWMYSVDFEFFDAAGNAFQPETKIAVELPMPSEQILVTLAPGETLLYEDTVEDVETYIDIDKAAFAVASYEVGDYVRMGLKDADYDLRATCVFSNVCVL